MSEPLHISDRPGAQEVFLGMPGYGNMTAGAARGLWFACKDVGRPIVKYQNGSLLAANFNMLWVTALNMQRAGYPIKYFAMLHDDIAPEDGWLDTLIDEMEAKDLDVLCAVSPIKDQMGLTSIALERPDGDTWRVLGRLTMSEVFKLPETFTSEDVGFRLLLNTGCWVCKFDPAWAPNVYFTINDRNYFDVVQDCYKSQVESEDWFFSRLCYEQGLKLGATRKVSLSHRGSAEFGNTHPWGQWTFDEAQLSRSVIPNPAVGEPSALVSSET